MLDHLQFCRIFSKSMYKNLKLPLAEMTFSKDFINDKRGDLYPVIKKSEDCMEIVENNCYKLHSGLCERMFTRFFPYATYAITLSGQNGNCGFVFHLPNTFAKIIRDKDTLSFQDPENQEQVLIKEKTPETTMIISCRPGAFDIYFENDGNIYFIHTFCTKKFANSNLQKVFEKSYVSVVAEGNIVIKAVNSYIDCGVSQADIRSIRYENGETMFENGKIYLTISIRIQECGFQGIFAWVPSTSQIELTGALFFDCGDGYWRNYLASSILYNRKTSEWYIWTSAFEHRHILCHAIFKGDPRFGVNVIDVISMDAADHTDTTAFLGFKGDEDPDFYYNEEENKWYMAICRLSAEDQKYRYVFFKSDHPFSGYTYIGSGYAGEETGGSFVNIEGEMTFVCGNSFSKRANYRIYNKNGMQDAKFDFDDGGFRGWGAVIPIEMGSRKRYFWLTFDRHKGSSYNWSYGNLYCFEAIFTDFSE